MRSCLQKVSICIRPWMPLRRGKRAVRASQRAISLNPESNPERDPFSGILIFKEKKEVSHRENL